MVTKQKRPLRRLLLAGAAALGLASPAIASCGGSFAPISEVNSLRVIAVVADHPYVTIPKDSMATDPIPVKFTMTYFDGYMDPNNPDAPVRTVQILWLGGCFNPIGDEYYGCYASLGEVFKSLQPGQLPPPGLVGVGDTFTLLLPQDLISRRPAPASGPHYGLAYVFFAACAGTIKPIPPSGTGRAGDFPLGCFDANGKNLGADSFVPGYTQVYAFEDGRVNNNPVVNGLTLDGKPAPEDSSQEATAPPCSATDDQRNGATGCSQTDPYSNCQSLAIDVDVPKDVAEVDPSGTSVDGKELHEAVWVDYFAEKGTIENEVALVSDATTGITADHKTRWLPPAEPGRVSLWAVVHDARGGAAVVQRDVLV